MLTGKQAFDYNAHYLWEFFTHLSWRNIIFKIHHMISSISHTILTFLYLGISLQSVHLVSMLVIFTYKVARWPEKLGNFGASERGFKCEHLLKMYKMWMENVYIWTRAFIQKCGPSLNPVRLRNSVTEKLNLVPCACKLNTVVTQWFMTPFTRAVHFCNAYARL